MSDVLSQREIDNLLRALNSGEVDMDKIETVNHPSHYNRKGSLECIDEMILLFGIEEVKSFCKLNAWKYRYRAADKNGQEDLKKSDWYINKYKELDEIELEPKYPPNVISFPNTVSVRPC